MLDSQKACRLASAKHTATADTAEVLGVAVPLLLDKGLQSRVPFVKAHTLSLLSSVIDAAAPTQIAPQLPALIQALLESLSSLEPSAFNTLELQAEGLGVKQSIVQEARMKMSQQTPMFSALERCVRLVTADSLEMVVPVLTDLIRRGASPLPAFDQAARFGLVSLEGRCLQRS
jgi:hypothetical protein